jgi:hypothetical protein
MRRVVIALLLASAAASPAVARPHTGFGGQQTNEERAQAREEARSERSESRPSFTPRQSEPRTQPRAQAVERQQASRPARVALQGNGNAARPAVGDRRAGNPGQRRAIVQGGREHQQVGRIRQPDRPLPPVARNPHPGPISNVPRPGTQPPPRVAQGHQSGQVHWNHNWRNDHRYDWRNYRRHHRSLFHFGFYLDPFGWGYQPFSIGWRLWPAYYGSQYWITDPWTYRLPYAAPGTVWIRYWNDAILVDRFSGTVIDVIPGFFW